MILEMGTNVPVSGVIIKVGDKEDSTDAKGFYRISDLETGERSVTCSKTGYKTLTETVTIKKGETINHNLLLAKESANKLPIANPGPTQNITTGSLVTLNGGESYDPDGDSITYVWTFVSKPEGSGAALADLDGINPKFTADMDGSYVVRLVVNDGLAESEPEEVTITATAANSAPVANAGADQNVTVGTVVTLDGSESSDVDNDTLTFFWEIKEAPAGSLAELSDPYSAAPTFTADETGSYLFNLYANDGSGESEADEVQIIAALENSAPVASAGLTQNVMEGALVILNGEASSDADSDPLTYLWIFTSLPAGSAVTLEENTSLAPTFRPDLPGTYIITLVVNDGKVDSQPDSVTIKAGVVEKAAEWDNGLWDKSLWGN